MALRDRSIVEMVADVRNRSGLESSQFRTDADITRYLNESGYKLTGKIIAEHPDANYLYKSGTISTTSGTSAYDLPNDCFQPLAFRVTLDGVRINIAKGDIDDPTWTPRLPTRDGGWTHSTVRLTCSWDLRQRSPASR